MHGEREMCLGILKRIDLANTLPPGSPLAFREKTRPAEISVEVLLHPFISSDLISIEQHAS